MSLFPRKVSLRIALSCGILLSASAGCSAQAPAPSPSSPESKRPVLLIGVDGASWKVIGPMIASGELPTMARFLEQGAACRQFEVVSPHSPVAWTSIATGRAPADHGVVEYVSELPDGSLVPASGHMRKVPAAWEIASRYDLSAGVVGWWATWPADAIDGYVVSDHANPALAEFMVKDGRYWTADPGLLTSLQRDVFPAEIAGLVQRTAVTPATFSLDEYQRRARLTPAQLELVQQASWYEREYYSHLKSFYAMDRSTVSAARALMSRQPTRLIMVYLRGPDPVQHKAWDLVEPEKYQVPSPFLDRDRGVVQAVYRYVDTFLGELADAIGEEAWIVIASDHGAEPQRSATLKSRRGRPGGHTHDAKGVLLVRGPHVRRGYRIAAANPLDLLPTILWLLELPLSRELEGRVLKEAFESSFANSRETLYVDSYGPRTVQPSVPSSVDERMLETLRSLGYID